MIDTSIALSAQHLSLRFPNGNGGLHALEDVSFAITRQEFISVVGPSGSGKTTLLRLLAGLLRPTEGQVLFEGTPLLRPLRQIGFVFQQSNLMPWRTVLGNVSLPLELQGARRAETERRSRELLELVGLTGFESTFPQDLSGGMAQRVAIARALIHDPDLLLLDEPFGALDALTRERMESELMRIWSARKVTVVLVTHSISEAVLLSDRVLVLSERPGRLHLDLPIPLARPRRLELTHTPEFGVLVAQVRAAIG